MSPTSQWLANRGYAVLQPNFRSSTGYGKKFLNAGNNEWGQKMQDDLTAGVRHLVSQGIVDPKRVGIMGGSYGGYAALAGKPYDQLVCTEKQGAFGSHGVHFFATHDSDNAFVGAPEPTTEIDGQQWQWAVPTDAPRNAQPSGLPRLTIRNESKSSMQRLRETQTGSRLKRC